MTKPLTAEQRLAELAKVRYYTTLSAREQRRVDKLKWHGRAMRHLYAFMRGEAPVDDDHGQGRLV